MRRIDKIESDSISEILKKINELITAVNELNGVPEFPNERKKVPFVEEFQYGDRVKETFGVCPMCGELIPKENHPDKCGYCKQKLLWPK